MSCCFHEETISCCFILYGFLVNLTESTTRTNCDKYTSDKGRFGSSVAWVLAKWKCKKLKTGNRWWVKSLWSGHWQASQGCDLKMRQTLLSRNKRSFDIQQKSCGNNGFYSHSQVSIHLHILTHNHTYSCRQTGASNCARHCNVQRLCRVLKQYSETETPGSDI